MMTEKRIHELISEELTRQYKKAKKEWLDSMKYTSFDFDWEPDWDYLRVETWFSVWKMNDKVVEDYLHSEYGSDWQVVLDGHVFQVWETMIVDFNTDLENTKKDLVYDKKNLGYPYS